MRLLVKLLGVLVAAAVLVVLVGTSIGPVELVVVLVFVAGAVSLVIRSERRSRGGTSSADPR